MHRSHRNIHCKKLYIILSQRAYCLQHLLTHFSTTEKLILQGGTSMEERKNKQPKPQPANDYDDGNIPEIDLPKSSDAANVIPDEVPRRDGPGGE